MLTTDVAGITVVDVINTAIDGRAPLYLGIVFVLFVPTDCSDRSAIDSVGLSARRSAVDSSATDADRGGNFLSSGVRLEVIEPVDGRSVRSASVG